MTLPIIIGTAMIGVVGVYLGGSALLAANNMPIPRTPVLGTPADVGLDYVDEPFLSRADEIPLAGWFIPASGDHAIILINGGEQNRVDSNLGSLNLAKDLHDHDIPLFMFDFRGRGESSGRSRAMAHNDRDIGGAVDIMTARGYEKITLVGFSAGAAATLLFASQNEVHSVISDSAFSDTDEMFIKEAMEGGHSETLVRFIKPGFFIMARLMYQCDTTNPVDVVGNIHCPILFIHGDADEKIPVHCVYDLYLASDNPQDEVWVTEGVGHTLSYLTYPHIYTQRIYDFMMLTGGA